MSKNNKTKWGVAILPLLALIGIIAGYSFINSDVTSQVSVVATATGPVTVTSISPNSLASGGYITLTGTGFFDPKNPRYNAVLCFKQYPGAVCKPSYAKATSDTQIRFLVPGTSVMPRGTYSMTLATAKGRVDLIQKFTVGTPDTSIPTPVPTTTSPVNAPVKYNLTVTKNGPADPAINKSISIYYGATTYCKNTCTIALPANRPIRLVAYAWNGSKLTWSGSANCAEGQNTAACTITMDKPQTIIATFTTVSTTTPSPVTNSGDLVISSMTITPQSPTVSTTDPYLYVSFVVKNIGTGPLTLPIGTKFVIYKNTNSSSGLVKYGGVEIGNPITIDAGNTRTFTMTTMQSPNIRATAGTVELIMSADTTGIVLETDKRNNNISKKITIVPAVTTIIQPSVWLQSLPTSTLQSGENTLFRFRITAGSSPLKLTSFSIRIATTTNSIATLSSHAFNDQGFSSLISTLPIPLTWKSATEKMTIATNITIPAGESRFFDVIGTINSYVINGASVTTELTDVSGITLTGTYKATVSK